MGVSGHGVSLMAGMGRGSASRRGEGRGISAESVLQVEGEGRDVRGIWGHGACLGTGIGGQMERSMLQGGDWGGRPRATKRISGRGWENKASRKARIGEGKVVGCLGAGMGEREASGYEACFGLERRRGHRGMERALGRGWGRQGYSVCLGEGMQGKGAWGKKRGEGRGASRHGACRGVRREKGGP
uniref:Uncharacterized protein n=1 Tax=Solanum lycopersicum TaxID=4081 RepID=K4CFU8_SOLLC